MDIMNLETFDSFCKTHKLSFHHAAYAKGYISRKTPCDQFHTEYYNGRFGEGLKVFYPNYTSTRYCRVSYFTR